MSQQIVALAADADQRARMGSEGLKRAEEIFSLESMVRAYEALYERLTENQPK
jgi:glycosyltransferase involved in cell wall biosynthesis